MFFYIFWDILEEKKGQECVKRGLLSVQDKIETIASVLPGKMTVFQF